MIELSNRKNPFRGKKQRIADRLLLGEGRGIVAEAEKTTPLYVSNVATEMRKMGITLPKPNTQVPSTNSDTSTDPKQPHNIDGEHLPEDNVNREPTENKDLADPELKLLKEGSDKIEQRSSTKKQRLALLQRTRRLLNEEKQLDDNVRLEDRKQWVSKMPFNFEDYSNGMRLSLRENPVSERRLRVFASKLNWGSDFDGNVERLLQEPYRVANHDASSFGEISKIHGFQMSEYPIPPNYPEDQWQIIFRELENDVSASEYAKHRNRLDHLRLIWTCPDDRSQLRHLGGPNFVCAKSHRLCYNCPDCGDMLNFDGSRFHCPHCINKATEA